MRERQATLLNNELIEATGRHMKMEQGLGGLGWVGV